MIPELGRSPGEGNGNPLQYSCLENSMDGGAWWAPARGVAESDTAERLHVRLLAPSAGRFDTAIHKGNSVWRTLLPLLQSASVSHTSVSTPRSNEDKDHLCGPGPS